jgi:hypothetical protein
MVQTLDPYFELLGIPQSEQPANCYRLLGIPEFTANKDVIGNAAARQMQFLRRVGGDRYLDEVQNILNEVAAARILLLNDNKRTEYDQKLRVDSSHAIKKPQQAAKESKTSVADVPTVQFVQLTGTRVGRVTNLRSAEIKIGSTPDCHVLIQETANSQACVTLEWNGKTWQAYSLNSIFVISGYRVLKTYDLNDGDIIRVGPLGPDLQFVELIDGQILVDEMETQVPQHTLQPKTKRTSKPKPARPVNDSQVLDDLEDLSASRSNSGSRSAKSLGSLSRKRKSSGSFKSAGSKSKSPKSKKKKFQKRVAKSDFNWAIAIFWLVVGSVIAAIVAGMILI